MSDTASFLLIFAGVLFPFVAMPLMWRRMKRVRAQVYAAAPREPHQEPWPEPLERDGALTLARSNDPNEELIALGARATQSRWPGSRGKSRRANPTLIWSDLGSRALQVSAETSRSGVMHLRGCRAHRDWCNYRA